MVCPASVSLWSNLPWYLKSWAVSLLSLHSGLLPFAGRSSITRSAPAFIDSLSKKLFETWRLTMARQVSAFSRSLPLSNYQGSVTRQLWPLAIMRRVSLIFMTLMARSMLRTVLRSKPPSFFFMVVRRGSSYWAGGSGILPSSCFSSCCLHSTSCYLSVPSTLLIFLFFIMSDSMLSKFMIQDSYISNFSGEKTLSTSYTRGFSLRSLPSASMKTCWLMEFLLRKRRMPVMEPSITFCTPGVKSNMKKIEWTPA